MNEKATHCILFLWNTFNIRADLGIQMQSYDTINEINNFKKKKMAI